MALLHDRGMNPGAPGAQKRALTPSRHKALR